MLPVIINNPVPDGHWLEMASWGSQIVLVIAAIITLLLGYRQIRESTRISHATLLLQLDERWDSADTKEARKLINSLSEQITRVVSEANPMAADGAKHGLVLTEWAKQMRLLRTEDEENYLKLVGMLGFFETLGLMVKRNYVSEADAISLLKGPILGMEVAFREHMLERGQEIGVPEGLFEHAFYLCDLAKKPT